MTDALFLDRDGVLNCLRVGDYVKQPDELEVLPGVPEAISLLRPHFRYIFIVTNQQGIGKGLMTEADLAAVHRKLIATIGPVDHIFHCPALASTHSFLRKPNIGMALQAKRMVGDISLRRCVMVGDSRTDMLFGRRAGMQTVLVGNQSDVWHTDPHLVDFRYPTLLNYALTLSKRSSS